MRSVPRGAPANRGRRRKRVREHGENCAPLGRRASVFPHAINHTSITLPKVLSGALLRSSKSRCWPKIGPTANVEFHSAN